MTADDSSGPTRGATGDNSSAPHASGPTIDLKAEDVTPGRAAARAGLLATRGGKLLAVAVTLEAVALIAIAGWLIWRAPDDAQPPASALDAGMVATLGELRTKIDQANAAASDARGAVESRLVAMEQTPRNAPSLAGELEAIRRDVRTLGATLESERGAREVLSRQVANTAAQATDSERRLSDQMAQQEKAAAAPAAVPGLDDLRRAVAALALSAALPRGGAFTNEYNSAVALFGADALTPLADFAANGLPSEATLRAALEDIGKAASPVPTPAQTSPSASPSLLDRFAASASSLVKISPADAPPPPDDALLRARALAAQGRIAAAADVLAQGDEATRGRVAGWLAQVDKRNAALAAARNLTAKALAALASGGTP